MSAVLADTYKGPWLHDPGRVVTDLAAAVADGADCVAGIGALGAQQAQHRPVDSVSTAWPLIDGRVNAAHLAGVKAARAAARCTAWTAGAAPPEAVELVINVDAAITIDHSDRKENAAATWKRTTRAVEWRARTRYPSTNPPQTTGNSPETIRYA